MKQGRAFLAGLTLSIILAGCAPPPTIEPTVLQEGAAHTSPLPLTPVLPTRTPAEGSQEPFCEDTTFWHLLWPHRRAPDHLPLAVRVGPEDDYWLLYQHSVVHRVADGQYTLYPFGEALGCGDCSNESNGTISIASDGTAWIGLRNGILELGGDGRVRFRGSAEVFPESEDEEGPLVLVVDTAGSVWASNTVGWLCHMEGEGWGCVNQSELPPAAHSLFPYTDWSIGPVVSGVRGQDDQIWFGTVRGVILNYQSGTYAVQDLNELFPGFISRIGAMAFDEQTGTLWAVETTPPDCAEGHLYESMGVFSRGSDAQWLAFEKSLFSTGIEDACWGVFSSIAVTQDGRVWAGMVMRHDLVYYDNEDWYSVRGEPLPSPSSVPWTSCSYVVDLAPTASGHLLVISLGGVYEYLGTDR